MYATLRTENEGYIDIENMPLVLMLSIGCLLVLV